MSAITLDGVSLIYRLAKQRIPSLKEYAIHFIRGALMYEELWALRDVSVSIDPGEVVGIVGRNGAGKSTMLKVIAGVLKPSHGRLTVNGRVAPLLELGTGFDFELTGVENVFLNALLLGHSRREVREHLEDIIEFSELRDFIDAPLRNYSSGMVARLGFAIATSWQPEILILDEVLTVGDTQFQRKCHERLQPILRQGATVLMVSHAPSSILAECTRCLWLADGRLMADGEPAAVLQQYDPDYRPRSAAAGKKSREPGVASGVGAGPGDVGDQVG